MVRTDAASKLTGEARFTVDYDETDMLYGCLLRSPCPAGRIVSIDTAKAESLPGVRRVVTVKDTPDSLAGWVLREQRLFAKEFVRFEGEPIAGVVADTAEQAYSAVAAIVLEIDETKPVGDIETALSENALLVHPDWSAYQPVSGQDYPRYGNVASELISDNDGVDNAFENADMIVEDEFVSNRQYQAYIEPSQMKKAPRPGGRFAKPPVYGFY